MKARSAGLLVAVLLMAMVGLPSAQATTVNWGVTKTTGPASDVSSGFEILNATTITNVGIYIELQDKANYGACIWGDKGSDGCTYLGTYALTWAAVCTRLG